MIPENEKISLAQCKKGLESDGSKFTDEDVIAIRDFFYRLAEWDYEVYLKTKKRDLQFEKEKQARLQSENENTELKEAA